MTDPRIIHISTDQLDVVLDDLLVLRPPIDRVRFCTEFVTTDLVCIYDRIDSNPRLVICGSGELGDPDTLILAGWLVVSKAQLAVLCGVQRQRHQRHPINPGLLANLLDDAGHGAPAVVPPTSEELARPRWRKDGQKRVYLG